jgi:hypothetical protein
MTYHLLLVLPVIFFWSCEGSIDVTSGGGSHPPAPVEVGTGVFPEESCCADDTECQDGLWCNGRELCDCWGECLPGRPPDCDDLDVCTIDQCNEAMDRCDHVALPNCCTVDADCNDLNPCTTDQCVAGLCTNVNVADGTVCGTGSTQCTPQMQCNAGVCGEVVSTGAACTYAGDACYDPGQCLANGLCGPVHHPPANDTCPGIVIPLGPTGDGSIAGTTQCALDDYTGTCGGTNTPDVVYSFGFTVPSGEYQLYDYNAVLDAMFNSVLYARTDCASAASQVLCNDDCISSTVLNCGLYTLGATDSAINIGPQPVGATRQYYLIVDGKGGQRGTFTLRVDRLAHANNPCQVRGDNPNVVDATAGGTFEGNIDAYADDMMDAGPSWIKAPCHGADVAAFDWPARAWFRLQPAAATTYRIQSDEISPPGWFDSVIEVWDNSLVRGCDGIKLYVACAHINGQDNVTVLNNLAVPGGSTYLVGISTYGRPTGGDYRIVFTVL